MVDIAGNEWTFRIIHGRQYFEQDEYKSVIDPDSREIRITDTIPLGEQLDLAAGAALAIFRESAGMIPVVPSEGGERALRA